MSSPNDSALDFLKRKRLNQMAAKQKQEAQVQQVPVAAPVQVVQQQPQPQQPPMGGAFSLGGTIGECDLGASPVMRGGIFGKQHNKMLSPLAMSNRTLFLSKNGSQGPQ